MISADYPQIISGKTSWRLKYLVQSADDQKTTESWQVMPGQFHSFVNLFLNQTLLDF